MHERVTDAHAQRQEEDEQQQVRCGEENWRTCTFAHVRGIMHMQGAHLLFVSTQSGGHVLVCVATMQPCEETYRLIVNGLD